MNEAEIYGQLNGIFNELFFRDDIVLKPETFSNDIEGWDSYKYVEILLTVEDRFSIKIPNREIEELRSIGDLVGLIISKTGQ